MNCDTCPQIDNHKYILIKCEEGLNTISQNVKSKIHNALKNETQCKLSIRKSLDNKEAIIECCSDVPQKALDFAENNLDFYQKGTAADARAYISANLANWETTEE
jgi:hypothetical protein